MPPEAGGEAPVSPEVHEALERLEKARERMLIAAIAFCDGAISAGQLKAVRELLREQDLQVTRLTGRRIPPFSDEVPDESPRPIDETAPPSLASLGPLEEVQLTPEPGVELSSHLTALERKMSRLEEDFAFGRVNLTQYQAIRRHYNEQREVALKLHTANPASDRWRVVLEEGKTVFLLQLNEAACMGFALYDIDTRARIFLQGTIGQSAEDAMALLGTFGPPVTGPTGGRMLATRTDDGHSLLLVPGRHTAALVMFSQDPPGWQVRAIREVQRNFEAANQGALARGERANLVFPDVSRIVKS